MKRDIYKELPENFHRQFEQTLSKVWLDSCGGHSCLRIRDGSGSRYDGMA